MGSSIIDRSRRSRRRWPRLLLCPLYSKNVIQEERPLRNYSEAREKEREREKPRRWRKRERESPPGWEGETIRRPFSELTKSRSKEQCITTGREDRRKMQNGPSIDQVGIWIKSKRGQRLGNRAISDLEESRPRYLHTSAFPFAFVVTRRSSVVVAGAVGSL